MATPKAESHPASELSDAKAGLQKGWVVGTRLGTAPHLAGHAGGGGSPLVGLLFPGRKSGFGSCCSPSSHGPSFRHACGQRSSEFRRRDSGLILWVRAQKEILAAGLCDGVPAVCGLRASGPPAWLETREWAGWQKGAQCARPQERLSLRGGYRALGTVADPRARGGGVSTLGQGAGGAVHGEGSSGASVRAALTAGAQSTPRQGPRLQGEKPARSWSA